MNPIELSLFSSRLTAVCGEMGAVLQRAAFSPNIRDRLDFSCAIFDVDGELCAQAAHIPVHLGSMAYAMKGIVQSVGWSEGDMVIVNDPYLGGTHLPDVTVIAPVYLNSKLQAFVANRAHHADIGAETPGSMPISSKLEEEGIIIPPTLLIKQGEVNDEFMDQLLANTTDKVTAQGDIAAQISANRSGAIRLQELINYSGDESFQTGLTELNAYAERLAADVYQQIPDGDYAFTDVMDDDGQGQRDINISACIKVRDGAINVDFGGTANQVSGNINCPLSVAAAAVYYVFRCLLPDYTPACAGTFRAITLSAPQGCLVNAERPAAVAAGNVETSTRIVDVIMGALVQAIPDKLAAASQGSMNNIAFGNKTTARDSDQNMSWDYYETIGGGMGAHMNGYGLSSVQTHMTNTLNTPIEVLESHYPLRIKRYAVREQSGGKGKHQGGNGIVREYEFLQAASCTLLTERRYNKPWGMQQGEPGELGTNLLNGNPVDAKVNLKLKAGDVLTINTPGGGGWGKA